jgi:outer membrane protein OmpA-like peptidoglycan-associated protein
MKSTRTTALLVAAATLLPTLAGATEVTLNAVQFPERREVTLTFDRLAPAPPGRLKAEVRFREGQGRIDFSFKDMKPAVLFGGDVTSYVLWAVTREGRTENLGEVWVREDSGSARYSTALKEFALMVTAEPYPLVDKPSALVMFTSQPADTPTARTTPFTFSDFAPAPKTGLSSIADVEYKSDTPLDLVQARTAYGLAEREGAESYAPEILHEASITLAQATNLASSSGHTKEMLDYSRRTVALASEALRMTSRKKEAERLADLIAKRRSEMEALEQRAAQAEASATQAEKQKEALQGVVATTQQQLADLQHDRASLQSEMERLAGEKVQLEQEMAALNSEKAQLQNQKEQLTSEKEDLSTRLQGALSQVAATENTARGFIVNLPDILFDLNEATLKPEARITLAKLTGILLIMPELNLRVEGHTDSTGSPSYNMRLSQRRADSVFDFLAQQGISSTRMKAVGYGMEDPIADNSTVEGRAKNRRVEIVIAKGEVQEAPQK